MGYLKSCAYKNVFCRDEMKHQDHSEPPSAARVPCASVPVREALPCGVTATFLPVGGGRPPVGGHQRVSVAAAATAGGNRPLGAADGLRLHSGDNRTRIPSLRGRKRVGICQRCQKFIFVEFL